MAKTPAQAAVDTLLEGLASLMKERGFRKDARTFRRTTEEGVVHVINFQMSAYGTAVEGRFAVNLGVFIPEVHAHFHPDAATKKVHVVDCVISERLAMLDGANLDVWWNTSSSVASLEDVSKRLRAHGFPYLDSFASRSQIIQAIRDSDYELASMLHPRIVAAIMLVKGGRLDEASAIMRTGIELAEKANRPSEVFHLRSEARALGIDTSLLP